ncbi:MAG: ABC transporter substrate-binding protein [Chloroflexi bacterium]|nr:ABC transporter substrate-binding protein [Chloroflexota bacterium]
MGRRTSRTRFIKYVSIGVLGAAMLLLAVSCRGAAPTPAPTTAPAPKPTAAAPAPAAPAAQATATPRPAAAPTQPPFTPTLPTPAAARIDRGGILVFPTNEAIISYDVHWVGTYNSVQPVSPIYNALLTFDQDKRLVVVPDLAEKWEVDATGTQYTFTLRKGVKFHSGKPFVCADAAASLDAMADAKISTLADVLFAYTGSRCPDDNTLVVKLKQRQATFLTVIAASRAVVQSKEMADAARASGNPRGDLQKQNSFLDGTGPFRFKSHVPGIEFQAERNPSYWKPDRPYLDGYKTVVFADLSAISAGFRARQISTTGLAQHLEPSVANQVMKNYPDAVLLTAPRNAWHNIQFNLQRAPYNDVRVRKAIWLAINQWETIDAAIEGWGTPGAFIGPHLPYALPKEEMEKYLFFQKDMPKRIAEAKKLMAEAGLGGGLKDELQVRFGIAYQRAALTAQQDLKQIGLDFEVTTLDTVTIDTRFRAGQYSLRTVPSSTTVDDPDGYWARFVCGNPGNLVKYCNPKFDELFNQQSQELDMQKRIAISHQVERLLLEDLPDHRPYYWWQATMFWNNVQGWRMIQADWTYNHDRLETTWCKGGKCR